MKRRKQHKAVEVLSVLNEILEGAGTGAKTGAAIGFGYTALKSNRSEDFVDDAVFVSTWCAIGGSAVGAVVGFGKAFIGRRLR